MSTNLVMAIAYLITEATHTGLTIRQVLAEVEAIGTVPKERWDELAFGFDNASHFWHDDSLNELLVLSIDEMKE